MANLRTPKGTIDLSPPQALRIDQIIAEITKIFKNHNGVPISTPMFELREILMGKYGEETKLIYNLEDQGGDICSLRYDLTVPFSRFLATNRISKLRRYQIGNVFRRDNPSFKTGRLREFTQADFDICGQNLPMVYDAEILKMIYEILIRLQNILEDKKEFVIKINDRRIIMGFLEISHVPVELRSTTCSTIDKYDKFTKLEMIKEFKEKGLNDEQINKIYEFIDFKDENEQVLGYLKKFTESTVEDFSSSTTNMEFKKAVEEFELLFIYLNAFDVKNVKFDLSLARGLEYYTGIIIESCFLNTETGSIIGGGRYDNLCKSISNFATPCVGFSVGVSRVFSLFEPLIIKKDILVGSGHGLMLEERLRILNELWSYGCNAETISGKKINFMDQVELAQKGNFKYIVFTGEAEFSQNILKIYNVEESKSFEIPRSELKNFILETRLG